MKNRRLKLASIGIALLTVGLFFLFSPKKTIYCTEVGQVVIAMLAVLIVLQLVNIYLNLKRRK